MPVNESHHVGERSINRIFAAISQRRPLLVHQEKDEYGGAESGKVTTRIDLVMYVFNSTSIKAEHLLNE